MSNFVNLGDIYQEINYICTCKICHSAKKQFVSSDCARDAEFPPFCDEPACTESQ
jgi:hypothetical protein